MPLATVGRVIYNEEVALLTARQERKEQEEQEQEAEVRAALPVH